MPAASFKEAWRGVLDSREREPATRFTASPPYYMRRLLANLVERRLKVTHLNQGKV